MGPASPPGARPPERPARGRRLVCPACGAPLHGTQVRGIAVDRCLRCHGVWLDPGELSQVTGVRRDLPEGLGLPRAGLLNPLCPVCDRRLATGRWRTGLPIWVETCARCHGIFLDRRAWARILETHRQPGRFLRSTENPGLRAMFEYYREPAEDRPLGGGDWLFQFLSGLPVEINQPSIHRPIVTWSLIAANLLVFLATGSALAAAVQGYGLVPAAFLEGAHPWTLVTSMFVHAGFWHLAGNMYFLYLLGDNVEDILGPFRHGVLYTVGGVAAALAFVAAHPDATVPCVGASGAVSAVMGAYLVGCPRARVTFLFLFLQYKVPAAGYLGFWAGLQALYFYLGLPGVAWEAHLGGFGLGIVLMLGMRTIARRGP